MLFAAQQNYLLGIYSTTALSCQYPRLHAPCLVGTVDLIRRAGSCKAVTDGCRFIGVRTPSWPSCYSEFDIGLAASNEEQPVITSPDKDDFCVATERLCSAHQAE